MAGAAGPGVCARALSGVSNNAAKKNEQMIFELILPLPLQIKTQRGSSAVLNITNLTCQGDFQFDLDQNI